jgi:hypothetical protein
MRSFEHTYLQWWLISKVSIMELQYYFWFTIFHLYTVLERAYYTTLTVYTSGLDPEDSRPYLCIPCYSQNKQQVFISS